MHPAGGQNLRTAEGFSLQILLITDVRNTPINGLIGVGSLVSVVAFIRACAENVAGTYAQVCLPGRAPGEVDVTRTQAVQIFTVEETHRFPVVTANATAE